MFLWKSVVLEKDLPTCQVFVISKYQQGDRCTKETMWRCRCRSATGGSEHRVILLSIHYKIS